MDLRNLCSKIDVDSIKAKLPQMPAIPHIKIPKSLPKLKSRKIFRTSREDVNRTSVKQAQVETSPAVLSLPSVQPSGFINLTPTRISTISSLMNEYSTGRRRRASDSIEQYDENTYRSANSIDDDYPSPLHGKIPATRATSRPNSPRMTASSSNVKMSLSEKLQKSYKDFSEFRFKNILAKKTVVRRDNIVVDYYIKRYEEDRVMEDRDQMRRDHQIANNYRLNFKELHHTSADSLNMNGSDSPIAKISVRKENDSPQHQKIRKARRDVNEKSDDESGMETPPRKRAPKASVIDGRRRRLSRDISQDSIPDEPSIPIQAPNTSSLWSIKTQQASRDLVGENRNTAAVKRSRKNRMAGLKSFSHEKLSGTGEVDKEYLPPSHPVKQPEAAEKVDDSNAINAMKLKMKRFKSTMSIKQQPPKSAAADHDEGDEDAGPRSPTMQKTIRERVNARLRRLKPGEATSAEDIDKEKDSPKKNEGGENLPLRTTLNKFQTWKKAFRNKPGDSGTGNEGSPEKQTHANVILEKLKNIRNRKNINNSGDVVDEEMAGEEKKANENTMDKFEKARQRTFKKMNDKMQKIFHKSQETIGKDIEMEGTACTMLRNRSPPPQRPPRTLRDECEHSSEDDAIEEIFTKPSAESYAVKPKIHAVWTTNPLLTESTESDDNGAEYPRVLIHQDDSDAFESTLIIAVTTSAPPQKPRMTEILPPATSTPAIRELEWIPDKEIISGLRKASPPAERKISVIGKKASLTRVPKLSSQSMDSNPDSISDPWIPKGAQGESLLSSVNNDRMPRRASVVELDDIEETEKAWCVHAMKPKNFYKTRSVDIFAENVMDDGMHEPFDDFDDHLRDEPVLKIDRKSNSEDESLSNRSSEEPDAPDDDNSSRITKIRVGIANEEILLLPSSPHFSLNDDYQQRQIGNSRESLDANFDENEEYDDDYDDDDDDDRPPSVAPSPPPSFSPPPPPLPLRQPLIRIAMSEVDAVPPLPTSKPPAPPTRPSPQIPERTESMARISKPLVKTASMRLAYTEQVKPADVGKVNKLISRFEQPATRSKAMERNGSEDYVYYKEDKENSLACDKEVDRNANSGQTEALPDINENNGNERELLTTVHPTQTEISPHSIWKQDSLDLGAVEAIVRTTRKRAAPKPQAVGITAAAVVTTDEVTSQPNCRDEENNNNNNKQVGKLLMSEKQDAAGETRTPQRNTNCNEICAAKQLIIPKLTLTSDLYTQNIDIQSQTSSEYGSPMEYPSSLIGSAETTPTPARSLLQDLSISGRRTRSMVRDDDQYYSFDSDEENSYYSISSVGSNRYVVEI